MAYSLWQGGARCAVSALGRDERGPGRATRWHTIAVADGRPGTGHFVGRTGQIQVLDDALDRAQAGVASLVVVSGEAGIGQDPVLSGGRRAGGASRVRRRMGCLLGRRRSAPLWPWQRILRDLGADATAAALDDDAGGPTVDPRRFALFVAVGDALTARCHESPVLVVLDDAHVCSGSLSVPSRCLRMR